MKRLLGVVSSTVFALATLGSPVLAGSDAANGGGWHDGAFYQFRFDFHAKAFPDGSVRGVFEWSSPEIDFRAKATLDCLAVDGSKATLGGVITSSTESGYVGEAASVTVADGGTGAAAGPDLMSFVHIGWPGDPCQRDDPTVFEVFKGNLIVTDR